METITLRTSTGMPKGTVEVVGKAHAGYRGTHNHDGRYLYILALGTDGTVYETKSSGGYRVARDQSRARARYDKEVNKAQGAHYQAHSTQGAKPTTLQGLFEAMKANDPSLPEWHDLPTFGGPDIENTLGIWSWDATHYIEGTCADDLQLVARDEGGEV